MFLCQPKKVSKRYGLAKVGLNYLILSNIVRYGQYFLKYHSGSPKIVNKIVQYCRIAEYQPIFANIVRHFQTNICSLVRYIQIFLGP